MDQAIYGTFFDIRRVYDLPDIDLVCTKPVVPPAPQPVSLGPASMLQQVGSWLTLKQSISGAQLDELRMLFCYIWLLVIFDWKSRK